jgi:hypothetical protein
MGFKKDEFPQGMVVLKMPMDDKAWYIDAAFYIMFLLWPIFPFFFVLEYSGKIDRNVSQVVFASVDLIIKTCHAYTLDQYKLGLRQTVFAYGFLDTVSRSLR